MKSTSIFLACLWIVLTIPAMAARSQPVPSPDKVPDGLEKSDWHSIRAAHEGWKHRFHAVEGGWLANNPGQQWTTSFDGRGFLATPKQADWKWGLQFQNYGFGENLIKVLNKPEVRASAQRLTYQWDDNVEEWFLNDSRGLEHGFIVKNRPAGGKEGEPLVFTLATVGSLRPNVSSDALTVHFRDAAGAPVLNYSGLKVWDADGTILTSRFEQGREGQFRIAVAETGAKYPLTIDPIAQQAYLKASNTSTAGSTPGDSFGFSVAANGDTVVVGAPYEDSSTTGVNSVSNNNAPYSGAAYVFVRSGTTWSQQAYLKASNTGAGDAFGISVAVSGNTVLVGSPGEATSRTGVNSTPNEAAVDSGAAYVFFRNGATWSQQAFLKASNTRAGEEFGWSAAADGQTLVIGARGLIGGTNGGSAYVFVRSGTTWSQQGYLKAFNTGGNESFGHSVAVSGDTVVVGAYLEHSSATGVNGTPNNGAVYSGAAYVFGRNGTAWSQQAFLKASNPAVHDWFGYSVAVSGDTIVIGAPYEDSTTAGMNGTPDEGADGSGAAYVFKKDGLTWSQQAYLKASDAGTDDTFGWSASLSGDTMVIGILREDSSTTGVNSTPNESAIDSGAACVFVRTGTVWSQQAYLKASNPGENDWFGWAVAVSGDTVVVGAKEEDSGTRGVNTTPNNNSSNSGAAYIFNGFGPVIEPPRMSVFSSGLQVLTGSTLPFGAVLTGASQERVFNIFNFGIAPLTLTGSPMVAVSGSTDFTVISQPSNTNIVPGDPGNFTVRFTPTGTGFKTATLSIINNTSDMNPFVIQLNGTASTPAALFANSVTSLTGNNKLPNATPFNDGVANLLKYAFNMSLTGPGVSILTSGTGTSGLPLITTPPGAPPGTLRFEFLRRKDIGLVYTPQKSASLTASSWSPLTSAPVVTSISSHLERVVYTEAPGPTPAPACFGRVQVVLP